MEICLKDLEEDHACIPIKVRLALPCSDSWRPASPIPRGLTESMTWVGSEGPAGGGCSVLLLSAPSYQIICAVVISAVEMHRQGWSVRGLLTSANISLQKKLVKRADS